jgi:hypothetical protein
MSTRAQVRFATRESGVSFNEHPEKIHAQFYVHSDGYPEGLGCQIAESLLKGEQLERWELEHVDSKHGDLEYIYYVWQDQGKSVWISIFEDKDYLRDDGSTYPLSRECIFVGTPEMLLKKYDSRFNEGPWPLLLMHPSVMCLPTTPLGLTKT